MAKKTPKIAIEYVSIEDLTKNKLNPRKSKKPGVLETSLKEYGFVNPIILYRVQANEALPEGTSFVVAGHQRIKGAEKKGLNDIPAVYYPFKSLEQAKAYGLMDNRSAEVVAEWDVNLFKQEVENLLAHGLELDKYGFEAKEYEEMCASYMDNMMGDFNRGGSTEELQSFGFGKDGKPGEKEGGKCDAKEDGNWFYAEYYGDDATFQELQAKLKPYMRTAHEITGENFKLIVETFLNHHKG